MSVLAGDTLPKLTKVLDTHYRRKIVKAALKERAMIDILGEIEWNMVRGKPQQASSTK